MRLALPQSRTDYVRKSFSYSGAITPIADKKGESIPSKEMSFILTITTGNTC